MGKLPITSPALKDLVGMRGRKYKSDKWLNQSQFYDCVSFKEQKLAGLQKAFNTRKIIENNMNTFSRIYPKAHTGSKHYDPIPWWLAGAQLVSLNFQTIDDNLLINQALFERNMNCGYVLKPQLGSEDIGSSSKVLKMTIISGQQLFKGVEGKQMKLVSGVNKTPYVHISLRGHINDAAKYTTKPGQNVFNPIWKEECQFLITFP